MILRKYAIEKLKERLHVGFGTKCYGLHKSDVDNLLNTLDTLLTENERLNEKYDNFRKDTKWYFANGELTKRENERLKAENSQLASAAIEKPPYKADLIAACDRKDALLRDMEWFWCRVNEDNDWNYYCPCCKRDRELGHAADCLLSTELEGLNNGA